jgi:DNA-directed RNA polymerase subunit N (RpoN/RPB10)
MVSIQGFYHVVLFPHILQKIKKIKNKKNKKKKKKKKKKNKKINATLSVRSNACRRMLTSCS